MAARRRGLGKGLDALLGANTAGALAGIEGDEELRRIPVDLLRRSPYQPRREFDRRALEELAQSIRRQGVVQAIVVRPTGGAKFEIIAGERRWRAAQQAGLHEIPAVVRQLDDRAAICLALIENIQREDLSALEEAAALSRLSREFGLTHDQTAQAVGRSRSAVTNLLRLLELAPEVKRLLQEGALEMGHARALLTLPAAAQAVAARRIARERLSTRATEALIKTLRDGGGKGAAAGRGGGKKRDGAADPDLRRLETDLTERLGAATRIRHRKSGKGTVQIQYGSLEQLDGILGRLRARGK